MEIIKLKFGVCCLYKNKKKAKGKAKSSLFGEEIQEDLGNEHDPMKRTTLSHELLLEKSEY